MLDKQPNERNQLWRTYRRNGNTSKWGTVHPLVILGIVLTTTVAGCTETSVPKRTLAPISQDTLTSPSFSTPVTSTLVSTPADSIIYDRLDPFFREDFGQVAHYEQLVLDLCFGHPPSEQVLQFIEAQVIEVQWTGPVVSPIELTCWAARVRLAPQSLPAISQIDGLYRLVLIEPAPKGDYLSKLDGIVRTLARYRENSADLTVFVQVREEVSQARIGELQRLGLTLIPETWIPPQGSNCPGFYVGTIQVSQIVQVARLSDIVGIASAETELKPSVEEDTSPGGYK